MPNWCDNTVTLTHSDSQKLDALEAELEKSDPQVLKHLRPYEGEWDYGWCVENWGTKWDANIVDHERLDENSIRITFETAWGPPTTLYEFLESENWSVEAYYHEGGMAFAGMYSDGFDEVFEFSGMSADEIEDELPQKLNEMYGIADYKREWETENEEDEWDPEDSDLNEDELKQALDDLEEDFAEQDAKSVPKGDRE